MAPLSARSMNSGDSRAQQPGPPPWSSQDDALRRLLRLLDHRDYHFVTPTPVTHAKVVARRRLATSVEDVLGWSMPFTAGVLPDALRRCLNEAGALVRDEMGERSLVRVSCLQGRRYVHSAHPTLAEDAVFLGPDSYRFADLIAAELRAVPLLPDARVADIGTGAGVGAIVVGGILPTAAIVMTDINPAALRFARVNAAAAGIAVEPVETTGLDGVDGHFDLVMTNPPYIIDPGARAYRHGGGLHGGQLSLDLARVAIAQLAPGGRLVLYTGSAIVAGEDRLRAELARIAGLSAMTMQYREIDPDVFGEELDNPGYEEVDRIAVVTAIIQRPFASR